MSKRKTESQIVAILKEADAGLFDRYNAISYFPFRAQRKASLSKYTYKFRWRFFFL